MILVLEFLSAENENRKLEDLPLADFGRLLERLLLSERIIIWVSQGVEVCFLRYPLHEFSRSKYYFPFIFRVSFHGKSLGGPTL